jgi:drug/metabolite transporter (DMT)-like permease
MHTTTGRWKLGLALALVTTVCWGVLPVALKIALEDIDAYTITWYRFGVSAFVLLVILGATGNLPAVRSLGPRAWLVLLIGLLGLVGNYVLYLVGLDHASPTLTQTVIQLAPMFFLFGGIILFKEKFSRVQWIGFAVLVLGLLLFFNRRLPELTDLSGGTGLGTALIVLAAVTWATYGLAQKALLRRLSPQQILLLIYLGAIVVLLPASSLGAVRHAGRLELWLLAFSCLNTLIAYGAFAEALRHWDASRIGAVLATAPLLTLATMWFTGHFFPQLIAPESLNAVSVLGSLLVVGGSALSALASR